MSDSNKDPSLNVKGSPKSKANRCLLGLGL